MGEIHTFTPCKRPALAAALDLRTQIEEAAQSALDTADRLIALLDQMEGDADREDGGDAEPSLGAPENLASQITWLRGSSSDREHSSPE